jgi:hypothetical protein
MKDMWELRKRYPVYKKNNPDIIASLERAFVRLIPGLTD